MQYGAEQAEGKDHVTTADITRILAKLNAMRPAGAIPITYRTHSPGGREGKFFQFFIGAKPVSQRIRGKQPAYAVLQFYYTMMKTGEDVQEQIRSQIEDESQF